MGDIAWRMFAGVGVAAIFEEPNTTGDELDPAADRNAPAVDPEGNLALIRFSTALDILEVVSDTTVTISHDLISAGTSPGLSASGVDATVSTNGSEAQRFGASYDSFDLVTHGQVSEPDFLIVVGDQVLFPGRPVQTHAAGAGRYCSAYATPTKIILHEWAVAAAVDLPSQDIDYRVIVFREPRDASGDKLYDFDAASGVTKLGFDRFSSDRAYLQVVAGGSPFGIAYGKTLDLHNGAMRFVNPDGSYYEPVSNDMKTRITVAAYNFTHTGAYGAAMNYTGSFTGPDQILVQAP